jgi:hypothetical protein
MCDSADGIDPTLLVAFADVDVNCGSWREGGGDVDILRGLAIGIAARVVGAINEDVFDRRGLVSGQRLEKFCDVGAGVS